MLQIRLLGQFDVRREGKRVTIPSRAGQSLLAYLTLTAGTSHRREKLAGMFWPDTNDENARKNLRQELWRIRKALAAQEPAQADYLLADEFTLTFNRNAEYWLDVSQMERPDLELQPLIANLSLYQGELLPGFYDEWIMLERERIQAVFEARMEALLEQLITAERWIAVQEWGERWLTLCGAREPAYRALMLASGVRGDPARVASLYQRCTDELREQLGVEPSPETRTLYEDLLKSTKTSPHTAAQPSGTITFLFTDIEGSTRLLEKLGGEYPAALSEHHAILRESIQKWNGREVDTQGDAFFVTFTRATDAVQCAAEAQRGLASHAWHAGEALRVRMGLHTGEPLIASTGYVGMDVHRAARIGDAGHGGQILLSHTTRELVAQDLPEGLSIRDLGEHRLKDMKFPSSIYQLVVDGLPADFPPIRTKASGAEAPTPGEAPFKGLQFFDVDDSELFFGREVLTSKLVDRLRDANFLSVVIGASGSGKSSLVRAGLIPAIKRMYEGWQVHILTPTAHPLEALAIELTRESESVTAAATLVDDLSKDPRSLYFFLSRRARPHHTLLVIDQFEELFTLCRDEFEREAFIDNLLAALTPTALPLGEARKGEGKVTLVITLRADFYAHLAQYPELRDAVAGGQEYIGPMTSEELRRAIEEPAGRGHWEFEPGLVDLILRDVGDEPGALPLLSHALLETWKRRAGHVLTLKGYADAGGVHGAIAHTAESVYRDLSPDEQAIMRNILLRLTEFGEGTEDTRRRASFNELMSQAADPDEVRRGLNRLAEARLVTLSEDSAEVAHEALIREWPQLREWLSQDREGIILHRRLTEAAQEWELLERDAGSVYRGARLAQANEWSALNPSVLNAQERMFLEASNRQAQQEEQEREEALQRELAAAKELAEHQQQSASRLRARNRVITAVGGIAVILALLAGTFGFQSNQAEEEAIRQQRLTLSRELAAASVSNLDVDPERSILLALQAVSIDQSPEAEGALHQAILASRVRHTLRGHTDAVTNVAVSPDGTRIATTSADGTAKIWDADTGNEIITLRGHSDAVWSVAFSPDGTRLVTGGSDKAAKVWDVSSGKVLLTLSGHTEGISGAVFNPADGGARIATASDDGTARVWDAQTGKEILTLAGLSGRISGVVFSPDGTRIATAQDEGIAKVWDADSGEELLTLSGPAEPVLAVAFSPDGRYLATADFDGMAKVWDIQTGETLLTLAGHHNSAIYSVMFSPDGSHLATSSSDNTAKVWDAATGAELFTLSGHTGPVTGVAFSPDSASLATASADGTARVWDLTSSHELLAFSADVDNLSSVAISPDATRLATAGRKVRVWEMATGKLLYELTGHTGFVDTIRFNTDGTRLATASQDGTARIWDLNRQRQILKLPVGQSGNVAVVFSPDGRQLAATGTDNTVSVMDASTGDQLLMLKGNTAPVVQLAFNPQATLLAGASQGGVLIWDLATGKQILKLSDAGPTFATAFSPDGKRLATGGPNATAALWDAATGQHIFTLFGHTRAVFSVAITSDGLRLATASGDGTVKIWDAESGDELFTLLGPTGGVLSVASSTDGARLATAGQDGIVRVYFLELDDLVMLARSRVTRSLTDEECLKYLHVPACPSH